MCGVFNKSVFSSLCYGFGSRLLVGFPSAKMVSSAISNLWPFVRRRDLLPDVNGGVGRLHFSS
jgi:hypothetical protein